MTDPLVVVDVCCDDEMVIALFEIQRLRTGAARLGGKAWAAKGSLTKSEWERKKVN